MKINHKLIIKKIIKKKSLISSLNFFLLLIKRSGHVKISCLFKENEIKNKMKGKEKWIDFP